MDPDMLYTLAKSAVVGVVAVGTAAGALELATNYFSSKNPPPSLENPAEPLPNYRQPRLHPRPSEPAPQDNGRPYRPRRSIDVIAGNQDVSAGPDESSGYRRHIDLQA